jgi:peptide/nickel transport system permease protein
MNGGEAAALAAAPQHTARARRRRWRRRYGFAALGAAVVVAWALLALLAPWIMPYRPDVVDVAHRLLAPSPQHWCGTDALGRDVATRVVYGARISLAVGFVVVLLGGLFGSLLGAVAAYARGWAEEALMRLTDLVFCFPPIILAMAIAAALGIGAVNTVIAMLVVWWPKFARLARSLVLAQRSLEYVEAAQTVGFGPAHILFRQIVPNAVGPLVVLVTLDLGNAIPGVRRPVVSRPWRGAADAGMGVDGGGGARTGAAMVGRDVPRSCHPDRGDRLQFRRRRHPRLAGPACQQTLTRFCASKA